MNPFNEELRDQAVHYATEWGWAVLPLYRTGADGRCLCKDGPACSSPGKHPATTHGLKDATLDPDTIRGWFDTDEPRNLGIATGPGSGLVVLDVDYRHGGEESLRELLAQPGPNPLVTVEARTGNGVHYYFKYPEGALLKNSVAKLGPGLDIRGEAGYVVAPPSVHANGKTYEFDLACEELGDFPAEWLARLNGSAGSINGNGKAAPGPPASRREGIYVPPPVNLIPDTITEGGRNNGLTKVAGLLRRYSLGQGAIEAALLAENERICTPPLGTGEVLKIAGSAIRNFKPEVNLFTGEPPTLDIEFLDTVTAREIVWLAAPLIPKGFFTIADGIEGIGKTFALLDLAKRLTRGEEMPFANERHEPANVLFLSVEDSPEYILKPRFEALGGNCSRLAILRGAFDFSDAGFGALEATIAAQAIEFVVIDPLFSFTGGADINKTSDVRPITDRLNQIAAKYEIAIVGVRHINKSKGLGEARAAGGHAVAWLQGARSGLIVGHDADDKSSRGIAQTKINIGPDSRTVFGFAIDAGGVFKWTGPTKLTVGEMLAREQQETGEDRDKLAAAVEFLQESLRDGPLLQKELESEARKTRDISRRTLERAKARAGVVSKKMGGSWFWERASEVEF